MVAYSFNKRFVAPIRVGLGLPVDEEIPPEPKTQTIRAIGKRRHARPDDIVQLYYGMRTKGCFLIGTGLCSSVEPIEIDVREHSMPIKLAGKHIGGGFSHDFARADGFTGIEDMHAFWKTEHGLGRFDGLLIQWRPISRELAESADD